MNKKRNFSKKALRDFELIDLATTSNDQNAFKKLMDNYKSSIYFTILKMINNTDDAEDLTNEAFLKAFGMSDNFSTIIGYTAMISVYIVLCGAIFSCNLGLNAISVEERDLTADFLISKPVTRNRILTAKLLAALTHMLIFSVVNSIILYTGIEVFRNGQEYSFSVFLLMILGIFIIGVLFFTVGLFISVVLKKMGSPIAFSLGLSFGFFILNSFDILLEDTFIKYFIPYDYFEFGYIIENAAFKTYGIIASIGLIIAFISGSYLFYSKRDIATAM